MTTRNLHRLSGVMAALQKQALNGICFLRACGGQSVGFIQGSNNTPVPICAVHKPEAEQRGYAAHTEAIQ
jgi:hypothetical protein